ncbi:succinate dehydrogenase, cytochrome b556 subunit [Paracoccus aerodenitrificans]|uniref:succinate dehydrogenase, cytochrome b556 subunit n=1 Tax=Paracoccus aerodenitrificans TaxID=3017781 RepID=UPI0022F04339|nr:succinate dehydrogenase, cytochrome b556 subunit [Paracoccus aerodenitrificans]WBU63095.1 succinate dehydrogenase, cytochrome b556 subunit [Paracoccus aerodenitrificans]
MADVNRGDRPLSPHLQVYRLPPAAITSIMNRITGHAMIAGLLLLAYWLLGVAVGGRTWDIANALTRSWFGWIVLVGSAWALWFHFLAGIRHFFYDSGIGLDIETARKTSFAIIIGSVVMTLLSLILYYI